jgi:hypothetical protein
VTTFAQSRWSLNDLLDAPDGPRFSDYQSQLDELLNEFEAARSILTPEIPIPAFVRILIYTKRSTSHTASGGFACCGSRKTRRSRKH